MNQAVKDEQRKQEAREMNEHFLKLQSSHMASLSPVEPSNSTNTTVVIDIPKYCHLNKEKDLTAFL